MDDSIYGDIGEYKPSRRFDQGASSSKADENQGKHRYFDKSNEEEERETGTIQSKFKNYGYVRLSKKNIPQEFCQKLFRELFLRIPFRLSKRFFFFNFREKFRENQQISLE